MKTNLIKILSVVLLVIAASSCEDVLDIEQHGARNVGEFYKTDDEALEGLAAIYYDISSQWQIWDFFIANGLSDDTYIGGGARGNDVGLEEMNEFRHNADNDRMKALFKVYYATIYRCNMLTSNIDPESESLVLQRCTAEAKVIRAYTYLRLVSFFGDVPLIVKELPGDYAQPTATLAEIYAQIELDLSSAIQSGSLLEKDNVDHQLVNVSKQLAQALLGKAYVYESTFLGVDKWNDARQTLGAVIASQKYKLFEGEYLDQFHIDGRFSCESMFETNRIADAQNLELNYALARLGWRTDRFKSDQLIAAKKAGLTDAADEAWGFMNPSYELYNAFLDMEGADGYRFNQVMTTYKQLDNIPLQIADGNSIYGNAGYFQKKFMTQNKEKVSIFNYATDQVLFRYAEVVLLAAEAELPLHGGSQAKVDQYVNMIKSRAGITELPGNYSLEDLQEEKRLEMCFEYTRFPDLVRWGIAKDVLADKGKRIPSLYGLYDGSDNSNEKFTDFDGYNVKWLETGGSGYQDKHKFLPIPQEELNVNKLITQHEGW
ncbi:RagB/SusD family nutrient uptake outer membrane protein [uncultured Draconibacterium sp.]|uniref:RagB/SusD family nutrient uptake outer membrane protein n=1 Tax=uncultured Draconibacterium sp. TaxID=1573823 RepID=UPI003217D442